MQRLVKAVAVGDLGDDFRIKAPPTAIVPLADVPCAGAGMAGAHPAVAGTRHPAVLTKFDGGDGLIDRAAGCDLHNKKVNSDDGPQGGDH